MYFYRTKIGVYRQAQKRVSSKNRVRCAVIFFTSPLAGEVAQSADEGAVVVVYVVLIIGQALAWRQWKIPEFISGSSTDVVAFLLSSL